MAISGRGPGEVVKFAKKAKEDRDKDKDSMKWQGVLDALDWVLGDQDKDPIDNQATGLPDMEAIVEMATKAKDGPPKDSEYKSTYYKGVWECLGWIVGRRSEPPRMQPPFW
jgi:hypothetical protein